jgi:hypothetical protein
VLVLNNYTLKELEWRVKDRIKDLTPNGRIFQGFSAHFLVKSVRLYAFGKELTEGKKTLEELSIQDRQTVYYEITVLFPPFYYSYAHTAPQALNASR